MKVWLAGGSGLLGSALARELTDRGHVVSMPGHGELDVLDSAAVRASLEADRPDAVVYAVGYTVVDRAEEEVEDCFLLNAWAATETARHAAELGAAFVYPSTDYVFDGTASAPIPPDAARAPLSSYGRSKAAGEAGVRDANPKAIVARTSWLYGSERPNFVDAMLERMASGDPLRVVDDQRGGPTWTRSAARGIAALLEAGAVGTFHVVDRGETSWYGLAAEAARMAGIDADLTPIATEAWPTPARRPKYSVLDPASAQTAIGRGFPHWRDSLRDYLTETDRLVNP